MEVEADFADGYDPTLPRQPGQLVVGGLVSQAGVVGMGAGAGGLTEFRRQLEGSAVSTLLVEDTHQHHDPDAGLASPLHHAVAIRVELHHVEVAVGVDDPAAGIRDHGRAGLAQSVSLDR